MSLKLYTKTGDGGHTSLLGGTKVSKADLQIAAYGNVDELNAFIGHLKDLISGEEEMGAQLYWIQNHLFTIGSLLAAEEGFSGFELPKISNAEVAQLEAWIDAYDAQLPPLKNFILPGGHPTVSMAHICRTVARRTERSIVAVKPADKVIVQFVNRLSDYFFIFARAIGKQLSIQEIPWSAS